MESTKRTQNSTGKAFLTTWQNSNIIIHEIKNFTTLGRSPANKIPVWDDKVSPKHIRIDLTQQGFLLKSLQSTHGCLVNNTIVLSCYLRQGDRIQVGDQDFVFSYHKPESLRYFKEITSQNKEWQKQLFHLPQIAQSDFPVLITGPSGTGKERIAQFIHKNSPRNHRPLISVNCSALSESLIESELFGHTKGSFTGADKNRHGAFLAAKGGTLFLDEIGDLPEALQPKFLRALENREVKPLGSDQVHPTDVRIIAATHQNLKIM